MRGKRVSRFPARAAGGGCRIRRCCGSWHSFPADAHNPAECVVKCAVILKTDFHGNFGQRRAFAHQKRGGIDAFFIDIELERAARDALERAGEIGGVVIGDPAQGFETQVSPIWRLM